MVFVYFAIFVGNGEERFCVVAASRGLNEVGDVHGHLVDLGVVELLDVLQIPLVLFGDKVDGDALTTESTSTTDPTDSGVGNQRQEANNWLVASWDNIGSLFHVLSESASLTCGCSSLCWWASRS